MPFRGCAMRRPLRVPHRALVGIGALLVLALVAIASATGYLVIAHGRSVTLPQPTGPYAVGRTEYDWVDQSREDPLAASAGQKREILATVWYPASAAPAATPAPYLPAKWVQLRQQDIGPVGALLEQRWDAVHSHAIADAPLAGKDEPFPVLIFLPGYGNGPEQYTTLAEELASQGYIVVGVTPTHSTQIVAFPDGHVALRTAAGSLPEQGTDAELRGAAGRLLTVWAQDARFAMDRLTALNIQSGDRFAGHMALEQIGVFGHSFGGATAAEVCRLDQRCKAGADLDGTLYGPVLRDGLSQPFLLFFAEDDQPCAAACVQDQQDRKSLISHLHSGGYNLTLRGARHFNFADYAVTFNPFLHLTGNVGRIDGPRGLQVTTAYLTAFFDRTLKGAPAPLLEGPASAYGEVEFTKR